MKPDPRPRHPKVEVDGTVVGTVSGEPYQLDWDTSTAAWGGATDDNALSGVSFYVDGDLVSHDRSPPWEASWDTCAGLSGAHTIEAEARDSGGRGTDQTITVTVDQALEVELVEPTGPVDGGEALAAWVASDESIVRVVWDLDGTEVGRATSGSTGVAGACSLVCEGDCEPFRSLPDVTALAAGTYTLTVTATDASGATATDSARVTLE